ncbi:DUF4177 domain-containing protein [Pseudohalocynthiibacter aestuariivivens]|jgi:hypothetical protein|uniref:DUF4177 domain-containing protein n=1 Tax=Pseudohalocynthiibacter aestuariivivens TaxID=1591409 RepID=A0ABV5JAD3_9RHOB|nr:MULTISPECIES: DUF4177 domain-containing protein [Pseudohalocynthiibacter]MBS9716854.1 DUF4177 domain-containing protein [Pseudohalocynthiibacter aestuariivivens]MCK0102053.1 DUF4177 domain-containing protein [Pseudohalocynthiibacter sp. F2068]
MPKFEYKVVPAPKKGERAKGLKSSDARFANTLMGVMNELGQDGWEYQRSDTLPCEERSGLTGKTTVFQNMLIFRRAIETGAETKTDSSVTLAVPQATGGFMHSAPTIQPALQDQENAAPALGSAKEAGKDEPKSEVAAE